MNNNKGFTLAELLIVVAIIAVLVGVSIPVFSSQLEKSREATDLVNVRARYSEIMTYALTEEDPGLDYITVTKNGNETIYTSYVSLKQQVKDWTTSTPITIGEVSYYGLDIKDKWEGLPESGGSCEISYSSKTGIKFLWSGKSVLVPTIFDTKEDYTGSITNAMTSTNSGKITGSYCLNSTCNENGTIKNVSAGITDEKFLNTIMSWAVVRDTSKSANNDNNNVLTLTSTNLYYL